MIINLTVPVFNEARVLGRCVAEIVVLASTRIGGEWELVIAENGSADGTAELAEELAAAHAGVRVLHLEERGRGRALKTAWLRSSADVLSYMDVDLATDLEALPGLIEPLCRGEFDLAVGSRLLRPEWTRRGCKREFISRRYNELVKTAFGTGFSDAQCGFKAITREAAMALLPLVESNGWFFDTELLVLAEKLGWRVYDLPVHWKEGAGSKVKIFRTALEFLAGIARLRRRMGHLDALGVNGRAPFRKAASV